MVIEKISIQTAFQVGALVLAMGVWYSNDKEQSRMLADHESRLRTIEKDFLVAFGELKGEFHGLKTRLSAIEKAVKH